MHSLPLFHRIRGERVVVAGDGDMAQAKRRLVERAGGVPVSVAEAHGAHIGFVALEDGREAEKTALRLKRAGLLVNVADRPELCDFTLPSVLDRDAVLVAVSTGGASAGLAKHLRLRLEAILPQSLGQLAAALFTARADFREHFPDARERRRILDRALQQGGLLDPFDETSASRVDPRRLKDGGVGQATTVEFLLSSGDPDDLTLRQARILGQADTVLHEPQIPEAILARARADAVREALSGGAPAQCKGLTVILRRA